MTTLEPWAIEPFEYPEWRAELSDEPLTILFGWTVSEGFLQVTLRQLMLEYLADYRGSDKLILGEDATHVARQIAALRQLADDMEKLAGL